MDESSSDSEPDEGGPRASTVSKVSRLSRAAEEEEEDVPSSSSEDEDERTKQLVEKIMTDKRDVQDPTAPLLADPEIEQTFSVTGRKTLDDVFMESMEIAERGFVKRLQPEEDLRVRPTISQYQIRPSLDQKFKSAIVKEMIHNVLNDELGGKEYSEEDVEKWTKSIAGTVRKKVTEMGFARYKFIVQCVIGEEHGAGVKIGARCLWDADTDNYASDTFLNETIFCMTAVYAIYFY